MNFLSDNAASPCPEVLAAIMAAAPAGTRAYDGDDISARLDAAFGAVFGQPCTVLPVLTGTAAIMIIAMCIRRLPYTIRSSAAILQQIPVTVEEAAISLGASKLKTFFRITVPMMSNGIISGSILSWVAIITELSTSIILYNAKTITLTLGIYTLVSRGTEGPAAAVATILTAFTILSLLLFFKISTSRDIVL